DARTRHGPEKQVTGVQTTQATAISADGACRADLKNRHGADAIQHHKCRSTASVAKSSGDASASGGNTHHTECGKCGRLCGPYNAVRISCDASVGSGYGRADTGCRDRG